MKLCIIAHEILNRFVKQVQVLQDKYHRDGLSIVELLYPFLWKISVTFWHRKFPDPFRVGNLWVPFGTGNLWFSCIRTERTCESGHITKNVLWNPIPLENWSFFFYYRHNNISERMQNLFARGHLASGPDHHKMTQGN